MVVVLNGEPRSQIAIAETEVQRLRRFRVMPAPYRLKRTVFKPIVMTLSSGIQVIVDPVPSVDSVAMGIWVRAGSRDEPSRKAGVAHLVEHAAFRRTEIRSARRIAREFENVGAYVNAYTEKEETCFYARTLSSHAKRVLTTLADVVLHPVFDRADIEKERSIIVEEIRSYEDESEEFIFDEAERQLFGGHPLGVPIVGTIPSVQRLTDVDARAFHRKHYRAANMIVAASGNIDLTEFSELVERTFSSAPMRRSVTERTLPRKGAVVEDIRKHPSQQAHILWHRRTTGMRSRDRLPLQVLNAILGDGILSRMNYRIRETAGLAYSIYSQLQLFSDVGMLSIYAALDEENVRRTQSMIESELRKLMTDGVKRSELARAKEQISSARIMSLESLSSRMNLIGKGMVDDGRPEDPYAVIRSLQSLTMDRMNDVARRLCHPDDWSRLLLLPDKDPHHGR
jgi:predicted Zn-dependent peptidase